MSTETWGYSRSFHLYFVKLQVILHLNSGMACPNHILFNLQIKSSGDLQGNPKWNPQTAFRAICTTVQIAAWSPIQCTVVNRSMPLFILEIKLKLSKLKKKKFWTWICLGLLGGLGESIANVIPSSLNKESIGDVADNCLENPDLFQGLYNLFGELIDWLIDW